MPNTSTLRIIGGKWRSRKITFVASPGIRPTTDRVRETVFNWLMHDISGANCLDLFAGSGALGFEALSRDAQQVLMIDKSLQVIHALKANAEILAATNCSFQCALLPRDFKKIPPQQFNIVFIDPPYYQNLVGVCCEKLLEYKLLGANALIYIEAERELDVATAIPKEFIMLHNNTAGRVRYVMCRF